jgi:phospholipid transport system substrate-binding protein
MRQTPARILALAALVLTAPALAQNEDLTKPLKLVVGSIRYEKDLAALKQFAGDEQGRLLLGEEWEKATADQRKEFTALFHTLFAKIAFPKIRENFKHLGAVNYEAPKVEGNTATVASTLVIEHPLKKQEMKVRYAMVKEGAAWKVVDVSVLGDSMLGGIRDEQIKPLLAEGGFPLVLERMRAKAKELEKQKLK